MKNEPPSCKSREIFEEMDFLEILKYIDDEARRRLVNKKSSVI